MPRKGYNEIIVDISNLDIHGDILDMGFACSGIMFRALKKSIMIRQCDEAAVTMDYPAGAADYDWECGYPTELPFCDRAFDSVIMFFSLSFIHKIYRRNKTIKEVHRVLKDGGRIYLWDYNYKFVLGFGKRIKAILPGREIVRVYPQQTGCRSCHLMDGVMPVIENYFTIDKSVNFGEYYYIEAVK